MKKTMFLAAVAVLALPLVAAAGPIKAGKWEVTIDTPAGPKTVTRCVTQEEADKPQAPKMRDGECKIDYFKVDGNVISFKATCPRGTVEGKTTYSGDTFTGETHMKMGDREMTQHSTGKFLGKCDGTETMPKQ